MSIIGKEITDFKVKDIHNGENKDERKKEVMGH